jgi:hypothetical protein
LVDLDGDGKLDLISGSWPGEIYFFRGKGQGDFDAPVQLKDKDGEILNPGGGLREEKDGSLFITGDAKFEETKDGSVVIYRGKRFKSTPDRPILTTGSASAVHAVDWNGDGTLDLLVGDVSGRVWLVPNEGTAKRYAFGKPTLLEAEGQQLSMTHGDAGPFAADWDGDGKLDLIVGAGDGSVWFYRNVGEAKVPKLAAGRMLVEPGKAEWGPNASKQPRRGVRAKVCVVDWNGDGRLDLLVGDFATQKPDRPDPTPAEQAEHDKLRKELEAAQKRFSTLWDKSHGPQRERDPEKIKKLKDEIGQAAKTTREMRAKLPPDVEEHGWVWLFLRKPAETKAAAK